MKFLYSFVLLLSLSVSSLIAQDAEIEVLTPEEMNNQPNFFLDNLEDANLPNDKGEVKLFVFRNENGEYSKEEAWVKPEMVFQLYVTSTEENEKEFPLEVFSFPNLQTLVFPLWKFTEVPAYLPNSLAKLQYLDLQGAPIASLPETLIDMKYLDSINLSETKVSDAELEKLKKLLPKVTFFK